MVWVARHEMARTVEDVLARRTRALFLNAQAALDMAPRVADLLARELHQDEHWRAEQLRRFADTAQNYLSARTPKTGQPEGVSFAAVEPRTTRLPASVMWLSGLPPESSSNRICAARRPISCFGCWIVVSGGSV